MACANNICSGGGSEKAAQAGDGEGSWTKEAQHLLIILTIDQDDYDYHHDNLQISPYLFPWIESFFTGK